MALITDPDSLSQGTPNAATLAQEGVKMMKVRLLKARGDNRVGSVVKLSEVKARRLIAADEAEKPEPLPQKRASPRSKRKYRR